MSGPTHQVLIASYKKDFVWLMYNLRSLRRYMKGFLPPVISVSQEDAAEAREIADREFPGTKVWVVNGRPGLGNLRAQISMMRGDLLCEEADYIWLVGSDCVVSGEFSPEPFFRGDQPVMLMNSYNHLSTVHAGTLPWREGVQAALGFRPDYEYMRRLPLMYPRGLFHATRTYMEWLHKMPFDDYVYGVGAHAQTSNRSDAANFSESNILGAYAHRFLPGAFRWVDLDGSADHYGATMRGFPNPMIQFWSHGGLDTVADIDFKYGDGQTTLGKTPRQVLRDLNL